MSLNKHQDHDDAESQSSAEVHEQLMRESTPILLGLRDKESIAINRSMRVETVGQKWADLPAGTKLKYVRYPENGKSVGRVTAYYPTPRGEAKMPLRSTDELFRNLGDAIDGMALYKDLVTTSTPCVLQNQATFSIQRGSKRLMIALPAGTTITVKSGSRGTQIQAVFGDRMDTFPATFALLQKLQAALYSNEFELPLEDDEEEKSPEPYDADAEFAKSLPLEFQAGVREAIVNNFGKKKREKKNEEA